MAGWALFVASAAGAFGLMVFAGFPRALRTLALAAAMLAAAGYAWQGRPALAGRPAVPVAGSSAIPEATIALRTAAFDRFGPASAYLTASDAMMRYGAPGAAAGFVQGGIRKHPDNVALWTQLGIIIASRDRALSPAARFAFLRAAAVAPREPAPWLFMGMAQIRGGDPRGGRVSWQRALALSPEAAGRSAIVERLALLDLLLARMDAP